MSAIGLGDEVLDLALRAAIASPADASILLAEIEARLAHAGVDSAELEGIRLEVHRLAQGDRT